MPQDQWSKIQKEKGFHEDVKMRPQEDLLDNDVLSQVDKVVSNCSQTLKHGAVARRGTYKLFLSVVECVVALFHLTIIYNHCLRKYAWKPSLESVVCVPVGPSGSVSCLFIRQRSMQPNHNENFGIRDIVYLYLLAIVDSLSARVIGFAACLRSSSQHVLRTP